MVVSVHGQISLSAQPRVEVDYNVANASVTTPNHEMEAKTAREKEKKHLDAKMTFVKACYLVPFFTFISMRLIASLMFENEHRKLIIIYLNLIRTFL